MFQRVKVEIAAWLLFALLAWGLLLPASLTPFAAVPQGCEAAGTVPLLNVWTVWWNADRFWHGFAEYWRAPIFHPARDAFVYSECHLPTIIVAPILWLTGSRFLAYNLYLGLSLTLNGGLAFHLLKRVGLRVPAALLGGVLMERLPFVMWQLGVLQLSVLAGILGSTLALLRWLKEPSLGNGVLLGTVLGLAYLSCNYYGLFLSVLLTVTFPCWVSLLVVHWRSAKGTLLRSAGLAAFIATLLILPVGWQQFQTAKHERWQWSAARVTALSAEPLDYLSAPFSPGYRLPLPERQAAWTLGGGILLFLFAVVGLLSGVQERDRRRWTIFCGLLLITAGILSCGIRSPWPRCMPYAWLQQFWPGFLNVRSPFRFAVFVQLAATLLAAQGWQAVHDWLNSFGMKRGAQVLSGMMAILLVLECWPTGLKSFSLANAGVPPAWVGWLQDETEPGDGVVCLPFVNGTGETAADLEETTLQMYWGTFHERPLLNGYSGYFPPRVFALKRAMETFPDAKSLAALRESGCRWCVVRENAAIAVDSIPDSLERCFTDEKAGVTIYRLRSE